MDLAYLRAHPQHLPTFLTHQRMRETPVSGGDVCTASRLTLDDGASVFAKSWPSGSPPEGFFEAEAAGLAGRVTAACGAEANMAKLLAADASWQAANVAMQTFGGSGFDVDNDVERKFRETRLYQVAPISTNLVLAHIAEHVLGLPRSF